MNTEDRANPVVAAKWAKVRAIVVARDGYTCQVCGSDHKLEVHHKYNWKHHPKYRFDVDYMVTLCHRCHKKFHWWMGGSWRKCTPAHYNKWCATRTSAAILWYLNLMLYGIITLTISGVLAWILSK